VRTRAQRWDEWRAAHPENEARNEVRRAQRAAHRAVSPTDGPGSDAFIVVNDRGGYTWSKSNILSALRKLARGHGGSARKETLERLASAGKGANWRQSKRPRYPSSKAVRDAFGSWSAALEAAGLPVFAGGSVRRDKCRRGHRDWAVTVNQRYCRTCLRASARRRRSGVSCSV